MNKELLLMIHGFNSSPQKCWGKFPALISEHKHLSNLYDIGFYKFPTAFFTVPFLQKSIRIQDLSNGLRTLINIKYKEYNTIGLVCHSLGGLIARKYLIEEVKSSNQLRVNRLLLFATPNEGNELASIAKYIPFSNHQLKQLCKTSDIIESLNEDWFKLKLNNILNVKYVAGGNDSVVGKRSVQNYWGNSGFEFIPDKGHMNIVKPTDKDDLSFLILEDFFALKDQVVNSLKNDTNIDTNNFKEDKKEAVLDLDKPILIRRIRKHEKLESANSIANIAIHPSGESIAFSQDNKLFIKILTDTFPEHIGKHDSNKIKINEFAVEHIHEEKGPSHSRVTPINTEIKDHLNYDSEAHYCKITDVSYSPNGECLASTDNQGNLKIWQLSIKSCICTISEHTDSITSVSFSPNGKYIATASFDEYLYLWKFKDILGSNFIPYKTFEKKSKIKKKARHQHDVEQIQSVAFSDNGKHIASGDQQGVVVVREISSGEEVFRKKIHHGYIRSLCFSPTEKGLLATASDDTRIRFINFFTGDLPVTVGVKKDKHTEPLNSIVFSHNGDLLISAGCDHQIKIWNTKNHELIYSLLHSDDHIVDKVAFFPNVYNFATDRFNSDISLWEISNSGDISNTKIKVEY